MLACGHFLQWITRGKDEFSCRGIHWGREGRSVGSGVHVPPLPLHCPRELWVQGGKEHLCLWILSWLVLAFSPSPLAYFYCCPGATFKFKRCLKGCRVQCCCWSAAVLGGPFVVKKLLLLERKGYVVGFFLLLLLWFCFLSLFKSREMEKLTVTARLSWQPSHMNHLIRPSSWRALCTSPCVRLLFFFFPSMGQINLHIEESLRHFKFKCDSVSVKLLANYQIYLLKPSRSLKSFLPGFDPVTKWCFSICDIIVIFMPTLWCHGLTVTSLQGQVEGEIRTW